MLLLPVAFCASDARGRNSSVLRQQGRCRIRSDFPLRPQKEPEKFRAILFGDTQPSTQKEVDYMAHDVVEELIGTDASFGVTLGDVAIKKKKWITLPKSKPSTHLWEALLPGNLAAGSHLLHVRTTDKHGRIYHGRRTLRVEAVAASNK